MATSHHRAPGTTLAGAATCLRGLAHRRRARRDSTVYQITDRLHADRIACVPATEIADTVSAWLADLGARSPLAGDLARAVTAGDWPTTHALADNLSLDIAVHA